MSNVGGVGPPDMASLFAGFERRLRVLERLGAPGGQPSFEQLSNAGAGVIPLDGQSYTYNAAAARWVPTGGEVPFALAGTMPTTLSTSPAYPIRFNGSITEVVATLGTSSGTTTAHVNINGANVVTLVFTGGSKLIGPTKYAIAVTRGQLLTVDVTGVATCADLVVAVRF